MDNIYLTREGYEKLASELEHFKTTRRRQIAKAIAQARSYGDLSENAEYDAAKDEQAHNEKRISEIEDKLSRVRIIEDENINANEIRIGAKVILKDLDIDEEIVYTLVSEEEADYLEGKISLASPVGKALLGKKKDDLVEISVPAGVLKYKIVEISR